MALSKTTQDHEEIRQWAEARGAKPAEVASTEKNGQTGILRIEFPGAVHANDSALKEISWDEFFEKFDASGLALVYQEQTAEGATSNFNKLIHPESAKPAAKKSSAKKSSAAPAKKVAVPAKKAAAPAKKVAPAKKAAAPAKKSSAPAKKGSAPAKKASAPAKKTASKKSSPAKKTAASKGSKR